MSNKTEKDSKALHKELSSHLEGEVRFDGGSRALYATDGSNYRQVPIGVVVPRTADDVLSTVEICRKFRAPLVARGGGTSLTGSSCNVAVVIDFSKYLNRVLEMNPREKYAWVEPGTICDTLRGDAEKHGLTFGPDPSTHNHCVLGGMIGNNSCGMHAQMAGRVSDNIHELEIVTYDGARMTVGETPPQELERIIREGGRRGEIYARLKALSERYAGPIREKFPPIPRRVSGYNLDYLLPENGFNVARALVGTEGTCALTLRAKCRLVYSPPKRTMLIIGFKDLYTCGDVVPEVTLLGPTAIEALDDKLVSFVRKSGKAMKALELLPDGSSYLMVEFGGETKEESDAKAERLARYFLQKGHPEGCIKIADDPDKEDKLWKVREGGLGSTAFIPGQPDNWEGWEDAGIPPDRIGHYLRDFRKLLDKYGYDCSLYGHFGQGCIHCRINFELKTTEGIRNFRAFIKEAAELVTRYGGSLSGEHGDGQSRGEFLPIMFGEELMEAFREFKRIWDPDCKMNPGKKINAHRVDEDLRLGTGYNPKPVETFFKYPEDGGFAHATLRCVGVGECRRLEGGTMCPSFRATREESYTTRGRAHMLFEMLRGDELKTWKDDQIRDALDLCLACKGCKGDCPVNVDVATLKAEYYAHYYRGRLRPRAAYSMGLIHRWAGIGSRMPGLVNFLSHHKATAPAFKWAGGLSPRREIPPFAKQTFKDWFHERPKRNLDKPPVILWADTFNNYFHPDVAKAAVDVLEDAGYQVVVPRARLCCGRPLYDFGMLPTAQKLLKRILSELQVPIKNGIPVVGVEPSCMAVFRDELVNLFPHVEQAQRLKKQSFILSEFLNQRVKDYAYPQVKRKAVVQVHCHQSAIFGGADELEVMKKMGMDAELIDGGCCGMAGSFGFEQSHYDISKKIAEQGMLPKIRKASPDTLVVTGGFSCHTQIEQLSRRKPIHLAEIMSQAIGERKRRQAPERSWPEGPRKEEAPAPAPEKTDRPGEAA